MYIIKQIPEDFIVKEISNVEIKDKGRHLYYKLRKKNRNTLDVIKEIAKQLNLKEKQVGFAGSKDRKAVTEQLISLPATKKEKINKVNIDNVSLELVGYGDKPISLGDLEGNSFEIVVRNISKLNVGKFNTSKIKFVENYFDEQRFSKNNVNIGRHLIKKEFKEAVKLIANPKSEEHLKEHKNDFVGALKKLPVRLLRMYANAYQSYLWNETLAEYLKKKGKISKEVPYSLGNFVFVSDADQFIALEIPLIGFTGEDFKSDFKLNSKLKEITAKIMKKEKLSYSDFVIKQIPELTLEGELRDAFVEVKDLKIGKEEKDELNKGKKKMKLKFSLEKGSYATMVIRKVMFNLK